jgi:hypothetical protein
LLFPPPSEIRATLNALNDEGVRALLSLNAEMEEEERILEEQLGEVPNTKP